MRWPPTGSNRHDVTQLLPLLDAIPSVRGLRGRGRILRGAGGRFVLGVALALFLFPLLGSYLPDRYSLAPTVVASRDLRGHKVDTAFAGLLSVRTRLGAAICR